MHYYVSGWAFKIWGLILLGEMGMAIGTLTTLGLNFLRSNFWLLRYSVIFNLYISCTHTDASLLQLSGAKCLLAATPHYAAASVCQMLWCVAFRPWARGAQWAPATLLTLATAFLYRVHSALSPAMATANDGEAGLTILGSLLARIPMGLHFGWLTAAALVSWNSYLSAAGVAAARRLTAAIASCYAAAGLLSTASWEARDPIPAIVAAWALVSVSQVSGCMRNTPGWQCL